VKVLFIGDAACSSGFAKASHHLLGVLRETCEVEVIGVNFRGDPHPDQKLYDIFPAMVGGDPIGVGRIKERLEANRPDLVVLQCNPWNVPTYLLRIPKEIPVVGIIAVEGKNCVGTQLNALKRAIFWTEFGRQEAIKGGMTIPSAVVPLGVDLDAFSPGDQLAARQALGLPEPCLDAFIVGNVNRNQNRKRLDLMIQYFAQWVLGAHITDAYLYLHVLPGSSTQCDCEQLAYYYGIGAGPNCRLIYAQPKDTFNGTTLAWLRDTYRAFDVFANTSLAEGWGLTAMEAMASRVPCVLPNNSAFGEWAREGALMVPSPMEGLMPDVKTMIGWVPDKLAWIEAVNRLYHSRDLRQITAQKGLDLVSRPEYRWEAIGRRFAEEIRTCLPVLAQV